MSRASRVNPDPYAVLGLSPDASLGEITAAYRRLVRAYHPDTAHADPHRLAAVLAAYHQLRAHPGQHEQLKPHAAGAAAAAQIPVRVHHSAPPPQRDLRAGPVHHRPS